MSQFHTIRCAVCGRTESTVTCVDDPEPFSDWTKLARDALCPKCTSGKVIVHDDSEILFSAIRRERI